MKKLCLLKDKLLSFYQKIMSRKNEFVMQNDLKIKEEDCRAGKHDWSSPYDYDSYPGAVRIVDSVCKSCGTRAQGSCQ